MNPPFSPGSLAARFIIYLVYLVAFVHLHLLCTNLIKAVLSQIISKHEFIKIRQQLRLKLEPRFDSMDLAYAIPNPEGSLFSGLFRLYI